MSGDAFQAGWGLGDCGCGCAGAGACGDSAPRGMGFLPPYDPNDDIWPVFDWDSWNPFAGWNFGGGGGGYIFPTIDYNPVIPPLDSCGRLIGSPGYGTTPCLENPSPCGEGTVLVRRDYRDAQGRESSRFECMPATVAPANPTAPSCPNGTVEIGGTGRCCPPGWTLEGGSGGQCKSPTGQRAQPQQRQQGGGSGSGGNIGGGVPRVNATPQQQCAAAGKLYNVATGQCMPAPATQQIQQICAAAGMPYNATLNSCYYDEASQGDSSLMWILGGLALFLLAR